MSDDNKRQSIPKFIVEQYGSSHAFRATKRKHLRAVLKALDDLSLGCAFLPGDGYDRVQAVRSSLGALKGQMSAKIWGR